MMTSTLARPEPDQHVDNGLLHCPQCGDLAVVEWRRSMPSSHGLVEHVKIRCLYGHWVLAPINVGMDRPAETVTA
jgi:hypothetical protein